MSDKAYGSTARPVSLDPFRRIVEVHWPSPAPVVILQLEGQMSWPSVGGSQFLFKSAVNDGDSVTIDGKTIKFGLSSGGLAIGADAAACAKTLSDYLNKEPKPVSTVEASLDSLGTTVRIFDDVSADTKSTLSSTGAAIETFGGVYIVETPLSTSTVITPEMYEGVALFDPFGNGSGLTQLTEDLIFLVYLSRLIWDPDLGAQYTRVVRNDYVHRFRRSMLLNYKVMESALIQIFANAPNNYQYFPSGFEPPLTGALPARLLQPTSQVIKATAYPQGTSFKVEADSVISSTATPTWTTTRTNIVQDTRGAPDSTSAAVNAYNLYSLPFPWATYTINKSGITP